MGLDRTARRRRLGAAIAACGLLASGVLTLCPRPASGAAGDIDLLAGTGPGHFVRSLGGIARFGSTLYVAEPEVNAVLAYDLGTGAASWYAGIPDQHASSGDGGPATAATFMQPEGLAVDGSGNLFVVDGEANVVRRVDATTHVVTTVVGSGTAGYSGDGGLATAAQLSAPVSVAVDAAGDLFVSDADNRVVRRVDDGTQFITTYAGDGSGTAVDGGPATASGMGPRDLALDGSGNLFVADQTNLRVRRVDAGTGDISTVAGDGTDGFSGDGGPATAAQLSAPVSVAMDAAGNLFIADQGNHRVRRVDAGTGNISTVAGDGSQTYDGDGHAATASAFPFLHSLAFDGSGNLLIGDEILRQVRRVDAGTGVLSTVVGGFFDVGDGGPATSAYLYVPYDTALGSDGSVYIVEAGASTVRKIAPDGTITKVVGSGNLGFYGDGGPATAAWLRNPTGIAIDASDNLYVYDAGNARIRKVDHQSGVITTVVGNGTGGYNGDGHAATATQISRGYDIEVDPQGRLVIADSADHRVLRVELDGTVTTIAGDGTAAVSGDGGPANAAAAMFPVNMAFDLDGNLYVSELFSSIVRRVDAGTGTISTFMGTADTPGSSGDGGGRESALLTMPAGLAFDGDGNLFVADVGGHRIRRVDTHTNVVSTVAGTGVAGDSGDDGAATAAELNAPAGLVLDGSGNLVVTEADGSRARTITAAGRPRHPAVVTTTTTAAPTTSTAEVATTAAAPSPAGPTTTATTGAGPGNAAAPATLPVTGAEITTAGRLGTGSVVVGVLLAIAGRRRRRSSRTGFGSA